MIDSKSFTIDWLEQVSSQYRNADKILIEKAIRALGLLSELVGTELEFVFKGGTALMLMLGAPKRLSIDIDIIVYSKPENIYNLFDRIINTSEFTRYIENERFVKSSIEKAHFKFYYAPAYKTYSDEDYILLDILFESIPYRRVETIPIASSLLVQNNEFQYVKVPSVNDILGDKLTAFAPNTTGIPYKKKERLMSMEILKQLFDIGNLFNVTSDLDEVSFVFESIAKTELIYRGLHSLTPNDVLQDIFETSFCISVRGMAGNCNYNELQTGIQRIKQFIISENFQIDRVIIAASKAAYLASLIINKQSEPLRFSGEIDIDSLTITNISYNKLNKLKKNNSEAFWYWYQAVGLLS